MLKYIKVTLIYLIVSLSCLINKSKFPMSDTLISFSYLISSKLQELETIVLHTLMPEDNLRAAKVK
jgi:hypothetical protein